MNEPTVPLLPILIGVGAVALYVAAIVFAIRQVMKSAELNSTERSIWMVAVLLAPFAGALVWYALGPHPFGLRAGRDPS